MILSMNARTFVLLHLEPVHGRGFQSPVRLKMCGTFLATITTNVFESGLQPTKAGQEVGVWLKEYWVEYAPRSDEEVEEME